MHHAQQMTAFGDDLVTSRSCVTCLPVMMHGIAPSNSCSRKFLQLYKSFVTATLGSADELAWTAGACNVK